MSTTENLLEVVRVKDPDGVERNVTRAEAKRLHVEPLDKPTVDRYGRPLPPRPDRSKTRTDLAGQPVVTERSTHDEIDAHAASLGVDLTGATTKSEKLAAIDAANTQES